PPNNHSFEPRVATVIRSPTPAVAVAAGVVALLAVVPAARVVRTLSARLAMSLPAALTLLLAAGVSALVVAAATVSAASSAARRLGRRGSPVVEVRQRDPRQALAGLALDARQRLLVVGRDQHEGV